MDEDVENVPEDTQEETMARGNLPKPGDVLAADFRDPAPVAAPAAAAGLDIADGKVGDASSPSPAPAKKNLFKVSAG